jgi:AcrR family transcriptional regulator
MNKKVERRNRMVQAARELFAEYGFEKTTMQKIADEASVGVATLFRYFPTKENLIIEVIKEVIEQQVPIFERIINSDKTAIEKMDDVLTAYVMYISKENSTSSKLLEAFEVYIAFTPIDVGLLEEIHNAYGKISSIILKIIDEGKREGSIQLSQTNELLMSTIMNMFGTAVKKYSLYSLIPEDVFIPAPKKENLIIIKDIILSYIKQA